MQAFGSVLGHWRRWNRRHWTLGVDDSGAAVRWVCLKRLHQGACEWVGAGQWPKDAKVGGPSGFDPQQQGLPVALALPISAVWQRHMAMPHDWDEDDQPTWAQSLMAQVMGLPMADVVVDWGPESNTALGSSWWLAGVRASVVRGREQWAQAHGAPLRIVDAQSAALERVLFTSVQGQSDPVWMWWASRDEGVLCTGWWHLGQWHDRQDVPIDLHHLDHMPTALLALVRAAQTQKPALSRMQWWWTGEALAPWAECWAADPPAACRAWHCQAAPLPFANQIESEAQGPAHAWAVALGLALHPGWR